ncbi:MULTISPECIES: DUF4199 domain-containing protein [Croceibacter]|jgi:hypothetical protein|uniref:Uncharacterized conserved membrane protein n=1 Tax=Croceibacter atlanticus (strain ATCC BAA-628 / JCM 21780 / CIP 108009 / IAM 15332 / KCTC 12090 / HTCC2559) TaxID=216432 RepID=A3UC31_CROAH|nr:MULTISPECIES: DUF4199 domain-containing protein [Croceibacter]HAT70551.1 DUF4199 domain-containing protein [Flavobacteriaceae bacterium]EAP86182.1 Uncharacterized conserved membrane protein [Croceibacter atlanticus HTCC2559]MAM22780.1 DUF4199 domain-containing protein [Croceibacter sp.]MBG24777.1 DUF4199 domain-containing protein [Croceibacter sp.]MBW4968956.1 DUF4199 domain-containing protein [Croceibacter atlanticus]|tara:strand:+ start:7209 stop:7694 length:486 start_codon:yes stop_codon:yes gene_type:complete
MNKFKIELKWGVYFTIAALAWMYVEKALGWHDELISKHAIYTNIFAIVAIAVYVLFMKDKKQNFYNGNMTWTQGFISGTILSVVVAILSPLAQYLTHEFITPNYFENVIAYTVEKGVMKQEAAEAYFSLYSYMAQAAFGALAMGVVTSAIVALFFRSKKVD